MLNVLEFFADRNEELDVGLSKPIDMVLLSEDPRNLFRLVGGSLCGHSRTAGDLYPLSLLFTEFFRRQICISLALAGDVLHNPADWVCSQAHLKQQPNEGDAKNILPAEKPVFLPQFAGADRCPEPKQFSLEKVVQVSWRNAHQALGDVGGIYFWLCGWHHLISKYKL